MRVLLNIDAGEHDDEPEELYAIADVVNVACGGHAGDEASMERVLRACKAHGTIVAAHPSFEDREGFGRRELRVDRAALRASVVRQCRALKAVADRVGVEVRLVKPHGALYHAANRDPSLALAVRDGALAGLDRTTLTLVGPPEGELRNLTRTSSTDFAREGFADRGMRADGTLLPRGEPGALITDPEAARVQARRLVASGAYDTLCVHGDTPDAVAIARAVKTELS